MELVIALFISIAFAAVLKVPIKKYPWIFYILTVFIVVVFSSQILFSVAPVLARILYPYLQRCLIAFGLLTLVMFIGVLPEGSAVRRYFVPIRGELSIIASILTLPHILNYLNSYLTQFISGFTGMTSLTILSFLISFVLVVILVPLCITSFNAVRRRIAPHTWKRIQKLAYPFYFLILLHILFLLAPAEASFSSKAFVSVLLYSVIVGVYVLLRARKAYADQKRSKEATISHT